MVGESKNQRTRDRQGAVGGEPCEVNANNKREYLTDRWWRFARQSGLQCPAGEAVNRHGTTGQATINRLNAQN